MPTRAEHRRATLIQLGEAAVACFEEQGSRATIDAIASRAGVSRRTVFRYANAKEELVYVHPVLWLDVWEEAVAKLSEHTLAQRLRAGGLAVAAFIDANPGPPRRAFLVALAHPELLPGFHAVFQRWIDRVALEALNDPDDAHDRFRSRVIGSAVMGLVDAASREWIAQPEHSFVELYSRGFEIVAPLLDGAER